MAIPTRLINDAAARSSIFVIMHELGHALINQLGLPLVGPEEDVVDEFATMTLILAAQKDEKYYHTLLDAANSWRLFWVLQQLPQVGRGPNTFPYWDEHRLHVQRYYDILCLLYGSNPGKFWPLMAESGISVDRARRCERDFARKLEAWRQTLQPHVRSEQGWFTRLLTRSGKLYVEIREASIPQHLGFLFFHADRALQGIVTIINESFWLPRDIPILLRTCGGEPNGFWNPETQTITLCIELLELYRQNFSRAFGVDPRRTTRIIQPPRRPQPVPTSPKTFDQTEIVGTWRYQGMGPEGIWITSTFTFDDNGRFEEELPPAVNQTITVTASGWYKFDPQASNPSRHHLIIEYTEVHPKQACGRVRDYTYCEEVSFSVPQKRWHITELKRNFFRSGQDTFTRQ